MVGISPCNKVFFYLYTLHNLRFSARSRYCSQWSSPKSVNRDSSKRLKLADCITIPIGRVTIDKTTFINRTQNKNYRYENWTITKKTRFDRLQNRSKFRRNKNTCKKPQTCGDTLTATENRTQYTLTYVCSPLNRHCVSLWHIEFYAKLLLLFFFLLL